MKIQSVQVGSRVVNGPLRVLAHQTVAANHHATPTADVIQTVLPGLTAGATANYAWSGFQASNTLGVDEISKLLVKNGLSPEYAATVSEQVREIIRSEPTKILLVAVSAGGTTWAAIEAGGRLLGLQVSVWRKAVISGAVAVVAGVAYHWLHTKGYVQ